MSKSPPYEEQYQIKVILTTLLQSLFNWRTKTPSDVTLLGRTSSEVFVMLVIAAVLHFCCYSSFIAFPRHPSPFRGLSWGFHSHFILSAQPIAEWFATVSFSTFPRSSFHSFNASATVLSGHFLPAGIFYLPFLHRHFTCVYQGFPGSRQFFLEVCRASYWSLKHRTGPSVCLIHSNPQPQSYFKKAATRKKVKRRIK